MNKEQLWLELETLTAAQCQPGNLLCLVNAQVEGIETILKRPFIDTIKWRVDPNNTSSGFVTQLETLTLGELFEGYLVLLTAPCHEGTPLDPIATQCLMGLKFVNLVGTPLAIKPIIRQALNDRIIKEELDTEESLVDTFVAIRDALQADPTADINTLVSAYKTAIENAFGVSFIADSGASAWGVVSLHFARLGFEAVARAFEKWVESQLNANDTRKISRYDLFQLALGHMILTNAATVSPLGNTALIEGRREGAKITIYRRSDPDRQAIMTPNNVIHELGHALDGRAGFGVKKLGSIEYIAGLFLQQFSPETRYNRDGMGPEYLRQQIEAGDLSHIYYSYGRIEPDPNDNTLADFPDLSGNDKTALLMYDIFGENYTLWNSNHNYQRLANLLPDARVDVLVQNYPAHDNTDSRGAEIVADAFLNWVRGTFDNSEKGQKWLGFFTVPQSYNSINYGLLMGMFLRNAVIYRVGMIPFYLAESMIFSPSGIKLTNTNPPLPNIRLAPIVNQSTNLGVAYNPLDPASDNDLQQTRIYGRATNEGVDWFAIEDTQERLVWIVQTGLLDVSPTDGDAIQNPLYLSPGREYAIEDLSVIVGM